MKTRTCSTSRWHRRIVILAAFTAACSAALSTPVSAQRTRAGSARSAAAGVDNIELALRLANFGKHERSAIAFLSAAEIFLANPMRALPANPGAASAAAGPVAPPAVSPLRESLSVQGLLQNARKHAGSNSALLSLVESLEKRAQAASKGRVDGPQHKYSQVPGHAVQAEPLVFRGNEPAVVLVSTDSEDAVHVRVRDADGTVVAMDTLPSVNAVVRWKPAKTAPYRVEVVNVRPTASWYLLVTN